MAVVILWYILYIYHFLGSMCLFNAIISCRGVTSQWLGQHRGMSSWVGPGNNLELSERHHGKVPPVSSEVWRKSLSVSYCTGKFPCNFYHCVYDLLRIRYKVISKIISLFCVLQCVDISSCGNFCVIGYSSGHVDKYNLQSGIHRGSLGDPCKSTCSVMTMTLNLSFLQMEHVFK